MVRGTVRVKCLALKHRTMSRARTQTQTARSGDKRTNHDAQVHLNNNQVQSDLHTKPTDKHQYLLKSSCHPAHTKRTIPFSLALRLRRICSTDHFFNKRCYELINYLALRGYSGGLLKREVNRVRHISRQEALKPGPQNNQPARTPFVITFNPALPNASAQAYGHFFPGGTVNHFPNCCKTVERERGSYDTLTVAHI